MPESVVEFSWTAWHGHPSVVIGLLALTCAYLLGVGPLRQRYGWADRVEASQVTIFLTGILILFIALLSPIHELGDNYLFSAHMVQHLLLISVVCPLLLLGTPAWLLRPMLRHPRAMGVARTLTLPVVAFVLFNLVFAFWHLPVLYDLALRQQGIHILEHLMFLGAGLIMWWPVLSPLPELPRSPYLVQMLYLFLQPTVPSILGAIITFSEGTLYEWYAEAPRIWGISAHADQQIGGLIMWIPGGLAFLLTMMVIFLIWASKEEPQAQHNSIGLRPGGNLSYADDVTTKERS
ncbi:MAG: cytochrome c oxidase assembly protein [Dehalococcoidia bacterium]|nr:cytochrome c oxidase assembly protein [Dehalococcoidia bacterium]